MSERFYLDWHLAVGPVELTGPEARHLTTVCRLRAGDEVYLFNGDGHEYSARIEAIGKRGVRLKILARACPKRELPFALEIAAPLPKGDRAHFLIEKLTELGVTTFVPLLCQRSVIQPREGKLEKLQRYVQEASKQCGRNILMRIEPPMDWQTFCSRGDAEELRILAHPETTVGQVANVANLPPRATPKKICCAVGPEGGFIEEEVALAAKNGWQTINLGPRILRVETAAFVMAAWFGKSET